MDTNCTNHHEGFEGFEGLEAVYIHELRISISIHPGNSYLSSCEFVEFVSEIGVN
jgi:hypothetical protein